MPHPTSKREIATALCLLIAVAVIFLIVYGDNKPDEVQAKKRLEAMVALTWDWLHMEDAHVEYMRKSLTGYNIGFVYTLVFDKNGADLDPEQKARLETFLPMCRETPLKKGARCAVTEQVAYLDVNGYGWVPAMFAIAQPDNLDKIAVK